MQTRSPTRSASPSLLTEARRVVVKVGSALLVDQVSGRLNRAWLEALVQDFRRMRRRGQQLIIVSSGAVALGRRQLGLAKGALPLEQKQAAAAVGQIRLAHAYKELLEEEGTTVAQLLLTLQDSEQRRRYLNARATLNTLLELGAIPVINENDTVVTDEIKFGDNDTLGALVANLVDADALVILTDQRGLYSADPRKDPSARFIDEATAGDAALERMAGGAGSSIGRGGMLTKVLAAKRAAGSGASTIIAWGREPDVLLRLAAGESIGTALVASTAKLAARKQWMVDHLQLRGAVVVDDGAVLKLREEGKSLLPIGVTAVEGDFHRGDVISVRSPHGTEIARGLANYSSAEARLIARKPSSQIAGLLGFANEIELIHRDNLVLV
jgi:glutamate 5-kinase